MARLGVLSVPGAFRAHLRALARLGVEGVEVRVPDVLVGIDGLVLPGGESSTQLRLLRWAGLGEPLSALVAEGCPVLGTCAGAILMAREVRSPAQESLAWIDVVAERNAYGRQLDSFEAKGDRGFPLVFIRAPRFVEIGGRVDVLETFDRDPVCVRQGNRFVTSFHPELTDDLTIFELAFL